MYQVIDDSNKIIAEFNNYASLMSAVRKGQFNGIIITVKRNPAYI